MSLINEALKKAQRQRTEAPVVVDTSIPPSTGGGSPRIAKRRQPMPARTLVLLIGGVFAVILMCGVLGFVIFRTDPSTPPAAKIEIAVVSSLPPEPAPLPAIAPLPPVVAVKLPPITPSDSTPPSSVEVSVVPEKPKPAPPKPVVLAPVANPRVYEFLETLRVSGIRASETDPKVIMNDRVFRINDLVDRATQLRLTRVESSSLTFVDGTGFEYRKTF